MKKEEKIVLEPEQHLLMQAIQEHINTYGSIKELELELIKTGIQIGKQL